MGLVDKLGGYQTALDIVRETLKLGKDAPISLETFPAPETPLDRAMKLLEKASTVRAL